MTTTKTTVTAVKMPKLLAGAALDKAINELHGKGQRMQDHMHKLALSVLVHVGTHKDIRIVHRFVQAMPAMARTNGLRAWFEKFGPVKFTEVDGVEQITYVAGNPAKPGDANQKPFWKFSATEGKPYEALDITKATEQFIQRLEKDAKATGRDLSALIDGIKAGRAAVALVPRQPVAVPAAQATLDVVDVLAN